MFQKDEKLIIGIGCIAIILVSILGVGKNILFPSSKVNYTQSESTSSKLDLKQKQDVFEVEVNSELDTNASSYFDEKDSVLKKIKLDFKDVDITKLGSYNVKVKYGSQSGSFSLKVVDTTAPEITVDHENVTFYIEDSSTVDEIIKYVNARVSDNYDKNIEINTWISEIPKEASTVTYTISVKDSSGNTATKDIVVVYSYNTPVTQTTTNTNGEVDTNQNIQPITPDVTVQDEQTTPDTPLE